ncbi:MAG: hypothetical protein D3919_14060 [Candidatus Electrothrix sp. AW5]|nr:hypothetical protein [Candidatus Electrothrix gigas]
MLRNFQIRYLYLWNTICTYEGNPEGPLVIFEERYENLGKSILENEKDDAFFLNKGERRRGY